MQLNLVLVSFGIVTAALTDSGLCGKQNNGTLCNPQGPYGGCCSQFGYCGSSPAHCSTNKGCQSGCDNGVPAAPTEPIKGCGDGFCDGRRETCNNCPGDCGTCRLKYLDKCVDPGEVTLTFDDGPDKFAPQLLATANELDVKLTLFVIGSKLQNTTYQQYLKQYYDAGHTIASHTYTHPFITKLTDDELREEMIKTDDAIFKVTGVRPIFMRNPYSDSNDRTMALLDGMGYKSIFTSLDTEDTIFGNSDPSRILTNTIEGLKANPNTTSYTLTEHETYKSSVNYLPSIVAEIRKRNYTVVSLDRCFGTSGVYRKDTCGDGSCTGYVENCLTCPSDCGACPVIA